MQTLASAVLDYGHLITTQPHSIRRVFISDLHLSADEPALVQAFLALLTDLIVLPNLQQLFILGDWFDAWVGDDAYLSLSQSQMAEHWLTPLIDKMRTLRGHGCHIFIMHGNRDFLIGQNFCDTFHGQLIKEPYVLKINDSLYRLEHGDALCTDDTAYQRYRKIIRHPIAKWLLLKQPLAKRLKLAQNIRQKSTEGKSTKAAYIMDVNEQAVAKASKGCHALLHGHTHRPNSHQFDVNGRLVTRYVLGDWRLSLPKSTIQPTHSKRRVNGVIGVSFAEPEHQQNERFELVNFEYS